MALPERAAARTAISPSRTNWTGFAHLWQNSEQAEAHGIEAAQSRVVEEFECLCGARQALEHLLHPGLIGQRIRLKTELKQHKKRLPL